MLNPELPTCLCGADAWVEKDGSNLRHYSHTMYACDRCGRHGLYIARDYHRFTEALVTTLMSDDEIDTRYADNVLLIKIESYARTEAGDFCMLDPSPVPPGHVVFVRDGLNHWVKREIDYFDQPRAPQQIDTA